MAQGNFGSAPVGMWARKRHRGESFGPARKSQNKQKTGINGSENHAVDRKRNEKTGEKGGVETTPDQNQKKEAQVRGVREGIVQLQRNLVGT